MASTEIYSVFGQIERVAAETLIADGTATRIEARDIPASVRVNERGEHAAFAIALPRSAIQRYENLLRDLYA